MVEKSLTWNGILSIYLVGSTWQELVQLGDGERAGKPTVLRMPSRKEAREKPLIQLETRQKLTQRCCFVSTDGEVTENRCHLTSNLLNGMRGVSCLTWYSSKHVELTYTYGPANLPSKAFPTSASIFLNKLWPRVTVESVNYIFIWGISRKGNRLECLYSFLADFSILAELFPLYVLLVVKDVLPLLLNRCAQRLWFLNCASILRTARSRGSTTVWCIAALYTYCC